MCKIKRVRIRSVAVVILVGWGFILSCQKGLEPFLSVSNNEENLVFPSTGGQWSMTLSTDQRWSASSNVPWCSIFPTSGEKGESVVVVSCLGSQESEPRTCEILISTQTLQKRIYIKQDKVPVLTSSQNVYEANAEGGELSVVVLHNVEYSIKMPDAQCDWLHLHNRTESIDSDKISFMLDENYSYFSRNAKVWLENEDMGIKTIITITQNGMPPINLSKNGTSNSYRVPLSNALFSIDASVKGNASNNDPKIYGAKDVKIIWQSGQLLDNLSYDEKNKMILFSTLRTEGNALIAVVDEEQNILWSWHLWITKYDFEKDYITFSDGTVLQNRYLGAFSENEAGLYYQWGRKDPFRMSCQSIMTPDKDSGSVDYSITHPDTFMRNNYDMTDWDWNNEHTSYWASNKTIYDPCPPGWKVMDGFQPCIPNDYIAEYSNNCIILSAPLCVPRTKFRTTGLFHVAGDVQGFYEFVCVWTNYGYYDIYYKGRLMEVRPDLNDNSVGYGGIGRVYGLNVRCQREKDKEYK